MNKPPTASFVKFMEFFPLIGLPFTLLADIRQIPSDSLPLPGELLDAYILPFEGDEADEYTEFIPIGRLIDTKNYHAIVYWRAGLMQYEFILATYTLEGELLSHAIIGGMRQDDEGMLHSVAVIHEDFTITIAEGLSQEKDHHGDPPGNAHTYRMIIDTTGTITYETHEEKEI